MFGFAAALFIFRNAGRFFQKQAQFFGFGLNDAADRALANDGVSAWAQTRAQKNVLHIAPPYHLVVDEVARCAVARKHPANGDFAKLTPLAPGAVVSVVEHQLHAGATGRFARGCAIENNVLHGLAAQFACTALAQYPAHGVHDVGFTAAVGAHHAYQLAWQQKIGGLNKGFEPGELDGIEAHKRIKLGLSS